MQRTEVIEGFLQEISTNDGEIMHDTCARIIDELPDTAKFNSFFVRNQARYLLTQEESRAGAAINEEPFDPSQD